MAAFLAALLAFPPGPAAQPAPEAPSFRDSLPAPGLSRDRLHAALARLPLEGPLLPSSAAPMPGGLTVLAKLPVLYLPPAAAENRPLVVVLESADDPGVQAAVRRLLDSLPANLLAHPGAIPPFSRLSVEAFRESARPDQTRAAADLLLSAGLLPGLAHFLVTAAPKGGPSLSAAREDPAVLRRFRLARAAAARARGQVRIYADALARALEPVGQRTHDLDLWALEQNRAAFENGDLLAGEYVRRLLDKAAPLGLAPEGGTRQARRAAEALSLEEGLSWEQAERERDLLLESLFGRAGGTGRTAVLRETESLSDGRSGPARHAALLLSAAGRAGVPAGETAAFRRFFRYAELAESLDLPALRGEIRRLESGLFGERNTAAQKRLLETTRDLRALRRAVGPAGEEWPAPGEDARWAAWLSLPERAEALAQAVDLTVPRPAFAWEDALAAVRSGAAAWNERLPPLIDAALKNRPAGEPLLFAAPPALAEAAAGAFRKKGAAVLIVSPLASPSGLPPSAAVLARPWGLRRLRTDDPDSPAAVRAADASAAGLLVLLKAMEGGPVPTLEPYARRLRIRAALKSARRTGGEGEARVRVRAEGLQEASFHWKWGAPGGAPPRGFEDAGTVQGPDGPRRLTFRQEPGFKGPWRWAARRARGVKTATRRFFSMQKRATLLTGAWMAGGVLLSIFAGAVSVVFLAAWLAVGVGVLVGVVFFGRDPGDRGEWAESFKAIGKRRKALMERLFASRPAVEER